MRITIGLMRIDIASTRINADFVRINDNATSVDTRSMPRSPMSMRIDTKLTAVDAEL